MVLGTLAEFDATCQARQSSRLSLLGLPGGLPGGGGGGLLGPASLGGGPGLHSSMGVIDNRREVLLVYRF